MGKNMLKDIFLSLVVIKTNWVKIGEMKETIFNPNEMWILQDGNIIVNDHAFRDAPIRKN